MIEKGELVSNRLLKR